MEHVLRIPAAYRRALRDTATAGLPNETMAYGLCGVINDPSVHRRTYTLRELHLPEAGDLTVATPTLVRASNRFKRSAWLQGCQEKMVVLDFHVHVGGVAPRFSATDMRGFRENADLIRRHFPVPVSFLSLVCDPDIERFTGLVWDAATDDFQTIECVEIVGSPLEELIREGATADQHTSAKLGRYDRQTRIPGFNQRLFSRLRAAVVGCGGNGAQVIPALAGMGIGADGGRLVLLDGDPVDETNLSRLMFATPADIGRNKAIVAAEFVQRHNPDIPVLAIPEFLRSDSSYSALRDCQVVFGCGDRAGVRKLLIEEAVRSLHVLIDLGCEIRSNANGDYDSGGQVRVLLPGQTGCAVCWGHLDLGQAALDLLSEPEKQARQRFGYLDDGDAPTPSISHLNLTTAALALNLFVRLVNGDEAKIPEFVGFDARTLKVVQTAMPPLDGCLVCGTDGLFGRGDDGNRPAPALPMPPAALPTSVLAFTVLQARGVDPLLLNCLRWYARMPAHVGQWLRARNETAEREAAQEHQTNRRSS